MPVLELLPGGSSRPLALPWGTVEELWPGGHAPFEPISGREQANWLFSLPSSASFAAIVRPALIHVHTTNRTTRNFSHRDLSTCTNRTQRHNGSAQTRNRRLSAVQDMADRSRMQRQIDREAVLAALADAAADAATALMEIGGTLLEAASAAGAAVAENGGEVSDVAWAAGNVVVSLGGTASEAGQAAADAAAAANACTRVVVDA